jgi:general secretion pathway protein D
MKKIVLLLIVGVLTTLAAGCAGSRAYQRGETYSHRGEWDLAVKEYREANKQAPQDIEYRSAKMRAEETAANQHYQKARSFVKERKLDQAIVELQQALYLNPSNAAIQSTLKSVLDIKQAEEHYRAALTFMELSRMNDAITELNQAVDLDPENAKYHDALDKLQKKKAETEPDDALTLASDKPITLNFKNTNIKEVFELLAKLSGINIMFDEEVKAQPITVFVKDVSFQYALNLLLSTNKLFMKKISADTIIIIPKNKAKSDQYQDLMVKTYYLNYAKSKEIVNLLRSMLDVKKVYVNEILNSITIRDTPEKIKLVEKMIAANDLKEGEVILDVEILEISRSNALKYGWNFTPGGLSASATVQAGTTAGSTATTGSGIALSELRNFSKNNVFLSLPGVVVDLIKQDSDAQVLANPRVRVLNNKPAKFHIGDKIPIQTSVVQAAVAGQTTSNFEYKDVGIKLNIEPTIHLNSTVTLKLGLEISSLGDPISFGNGQVQYKFGTRNTDTVINLRDGETVIIGGLIKDEERRGNIKIPLLGDIPILGKLFSHSDDGTIKTDILMSITPNIVRSMEIPDKDMQNFWSGTEEAFDTKPLFVTTANKSTRSPEKTIDKTAVLDALAKREPAGVPEVQRTEKAAPVEPPTMQKPASAASAPTTGGSVLEMKPAGVNVSVGQDMRFELSLDNVRELYGAIVTLGYDPKITEFKIASEGTLLKKDGQQTSFLFSNNVKAGTVDIYMTRIGDVGGVSGAGSLGTLVFQSKAGGAGEISLRSVKLTNFNREPIKAELKGAKITVK